MQLIPEWRRITAYSLSFWMQIFGLLALVIPEVWFAITGRDYDPVLFWWIGVLLLLAGTIGRLFRQTASRRREWLRLIAVGVIVLLLSVLLSGAVRAQATEAETLAIAVPHIASEEGERLVAYRDIVGVPTICFGSTRGVKMGMRMTHEECLGLLRSEVAEYREGLHRYFTPKTTMQRLTPQRDTAYTSLAFNVGIAGAGKSTATRRLNAGNIRGGCEAITWWNKAGGRVIRGLVKRRQREFDLCMVGI